MRVRLADDLPGVAGVGENFLITGKAGIENNFAASAGAGARGAAVKDLSVFEREYRASSGNCGQCVLQKISSRCGVDRRR